MRCRELLGAVKLLFSVRNSKGGSVRSVLFCACSKKHRLKQDKPRTVSYINYQVRSKERTMLIT